MAVSLRSRLNDLAATFSASVLDAIRGASLEELISSGGKVPPAVRSAGTASAIPRGAAAPAAGPRRRAGRLSRRSSGDIAQAIDRIVGLLKENPGGLRAEQIRKKLGLQAKELPRPIKEGLEAGRFAKSGQKRATTYFVRGAARPEKAAPRRARSARSTRGTGRRRSRRTKGRKAR
jgi:hypothetical protein